MSDYVRVPRELLSDLVAYGDIHSVRGVIYGPGRSHEDRINEARELLAAPQAIAPSEGMPPEPNGVMLLRATKAGEFPGVTLSEAAQEELDYIDALRAYAERLQTDLSVAFKCNEAYAVRSLRAQPQDEK